MSVNKFHSIYFQSHFHELTTNTYWRDLKFIRYFYYNVYNKQDKYVLRKTGPSVSNSYFFHIYTFNIFSISINSGMLIMEFYKSVSASDHYALFQNTTVSTARNFHWLSTTVFNRSLHGRKLPIWNYYAFD